MRDGIGKGTGFHSKIPQSRYLKTITITFTLTWVSRNKPDIYFWFTMSLHEHMWRQKSMESRLLIALIVIRNSAFYCDRNFWNLLEDTKSMVSKLLIALIVIRNLAFFDRNFWHRHKKYGAKSVNYSWCNKKFCVFCWSTLWTWVSCLAIIFLFTMSLHEHMWRQKSMESRLLIALFVIRTSAFYCDRSFWNLKTCRHKKHGVKTFSCSHCDKKFGLFDRNFWN